MSVAWELGLSQQVRAAPHGAQRATQPCSLPCKSHHQLQPRRPRSGIGPPNSCRPHLVPLVKHGCQLGVGQAAHLWTRREQARAWGVLTVCVCTACWCKCR